MSKEDCPRTTLLTAWERLAAEFRLTIVGDGPLRDRVLEACGADGRIRYAGWKSLGEVLQIIGDAAALIMPSTWYETFGRTIIEAYSKGTPVIASQLGAMAEIVTHGRTGLLFAPGDAAELALRIEQIASDSKLRAAMRRACRHEFETKYTADINYQLLMSLFQRVLPKRRAVDQAILAPHKVVA